MWLFQTAILNIALVLMFALPANAATWQFGGIKLDAATTATAAGTTTLTNSSKQIQEFTGVTTQNVVLPDATTLSLGYWFEVINTSTGLVTVKDGAAATLKILGQNDSVWLTTQSIGSAAGSWSVDAHFGNFSGATITASISGNATTATALAANPTDCGAGTKATAIDAQGNLTCSAVSLTADVSGILPVPNGGTGIASGTSGGVPYFSSSTTIASSALLAANQIILGGGAGAAPVTLGSLGTTNTVLHGNAGGAPSYAAVSLTADVSGTLPIANGGTGQTSAANAFGALSPLTTKGDILGYSTVNARVPIGSDGQCLVADSTQTLGLKWASCTAGSATTPYVYTAYFGDDCGWSNATAGGGYAAYTGDASCTLNVIKKLNFVTITAAGGGTSRPGLTITAVETGTYNLCFTGAPENHGTNVGANAGFELRDTTNTVSLGYATQQNTVGAAVAHYDDWTICSSVDIAAAGTLTVEILSKNQGTGSANTWGGTGVFGKTLQVSVWEAH